MPIDSEDDTPQPRPRVVSDASRAIADVALALHGIAIDLAQAARVIDGLEGDARAHLLSDLERRLGELGDGAHAARRAVAGLRGTMG